MVTDRGVTVINHRGAGHWASFLEGAVADELAAALAALIAAAGAPS